MLTSSTSRSWLSSALFTASSTLVPPCPSPKPTAQTPAPIIIALMSAKSRFIIPGTLRVSVMLFMKSATLRLATANASLMGSFPATFLSLLLSMTTTLSQTSSIFWRPSLAFPSRVPSTLKGIVTTPMVRAPISRAILATTGDAPVPVPPPSAAATKTRLASPMAFSISGALSSAALTPCSGYPPHPSPPVNV